MFPYSAVFNFPDDYVPLKEKLSHEHMSNIGKAIYSRWWNGNTLYGWGDVSKYRLLEEYAEARQPEDVYMRRYRGLDTKGGQDKNIPSEFKEKGYNNINPKINSTAQKHIATIHSRLKEADYMIDAESLNKDAVAQRTLAKLRAYHTSKTVNGILKAVGVEPIKTPFQFESRAELEIFERYHGWKLPFDTALIMTSKHTLDISLWEQQFEDHVDSFLQTGSAVTKVDYNDQGAVVINYIHPGDFICQYFKKQKNMEPVYAGHISQVKIIDIEQDLIAQGATEADLEAIARIWAPFFNNATGVGYGSFDYNQKDPTTGRFLWREFTCVLFNFEYMTVDRKTYRKYKKGDGTLMYEEEKEQKEGNNKNTLKRDTVSKHIVLEGKWIVGTRWMTKYGVQKNMILKDDGTPALSYTIENVPGKPIVESWIPDLDGRQMAWLKMQAAVIAAAPKGLYIDIGLLANMSLGDDIKANPLEIARIRRETGNQFGQSTADMLARGVNPKGAIAELEGGIGIQQQEWMAQMQFHEQQMMEKAGITPSTSGSPTNQPDLVGLAQMETIATDNALYRIKQGLIQLKEKSIKKALSKIRASIDGEKMCEKYYEGVLSQYTVKTLRTYSTLTMNQIGVKLRPYPNRERKLVILQAAQKAVDTGALPPDGFLVVEKFLEEGYVEWAAAYLTIERIKSETRRRQEQLELSKANAQNQQVAGESVAKVKAQENKAIEDAKKDRELSVEQMKGENEKTAKILQGEIDLNLIAAEGDQERRSGKDISGRM